MDTEFLVKLILSGSDVFLLAKEVTNGRGFNHEGIDHGCGNGDGYSWGGGNCMGNGGSFTWGDRCGFGLHYDEMREEYGYRIPR